MAADEERDAAAERAARLAAALRENLRRRKTQAKGRLGGAPAGEASPVAATTPGEENPQDPTSGRIVPPAHKR